MVTSLSAGFQRSIDSKFAIPDDSKYNPTNRKIMLSINIYVPYNLTLNVDNNYTKFVDSYKYGLTTNFRAIYAKYVSRNIPELF